MPEGEDYELNVRISDELYNKIIEQPGENISEKIWIIILRYYQKNYGEVVP